MMTGLNLARVLDALKVLEEQSVGEPRTLRIVQDYDVANVSDKVVRIIYSYTDYIRRVVWREYAND